MNGKINDLPLERVREIRQRNGWSGMAIGMAQELNGGWYNPSRFNMQTNTLEKKWSCDRAGKPCLANLSLLGYSIRAHLSQPTKNCLLVSVIVDTSFHFLGITSRYWQPIICKLVFRTNTLYQYRHPPPPYTNASIYASVTFCTPSALVLTSFTFDRRACGTSIFISFYFLSFWYLTLLLLIVQNSIHSSHSWFFTNPNWEADDWKARV